MSRLGRDAPHRVAMLKNMVTSLIYHERIKTTTPKAKELRKMADKMITYAKKGDLHNRRLASTYIKEKAALVKLFEILGPRYNERNGGYTRVMNIAQPRLNDSAKMSFIEFVDRDGELRTPNAGSGSDAFNATKNLRNKVKKQPPVTEED